MRLGGGWGGEVVGWWGGGEGCRCAIKTHIRREHTELGLLLAAIRANRWYVLEIAHLEQALVHGFAEGLPLGVAPGFRVSGFGFRV
jgi:hypothetical protein